MPYKGYKAYRAQTPRQKQQAQAYAKGKRDAALARKRSVVPGVTRTGGFYRRMTAGGAENKFLDTALSWNFDLTGEVPATGGQINLIPQGDTQSTRDGRKATITSILVKGSVSFLPTAAGAAADILHLYLVLDTQCNGAPAGVTDVFTGTNIADSPLNLSNSERFKILKHWKWNVCAKAGVATAFAGDSRALQWYKKCNIPLIFSSTTGAITEIRSNNVFFIAGSAGGSDDIGGFSGTCRIRFQG